MFSSFLNKIVYKNRRFELIQKNSCSVLGMGFLFRKIPFFIDKLKVESDSCKGRGC